MLLRPRSAPAGLAGGPAPGGALRGDLGCERGRQAEIDDRERYRRGAALSELLFHPPQPVEGAGRSVPARHLPVAAGGPPGIEPVSAVGLQGRLGCGALGLCAGSRPKTRGSFGQSESGSASLSIGPWTRSSKRSMDVHRSQGATDLNRAPAASFSSAGGSTVGVVPKRCCLGHT